MDNFRLIKYFGDQLGINLDYNPDGAYSFEIDGLAFAIHDLSDCGRIVLSGDIGSPPPGDRERLYKTLLEAQYMLKCTGGATFSINPDTGNFTLCKVVVTAILDGDEFFRETENFVNAFHSWAGVISNYRSGIASEGESPSFIHDTGLMSV